MPIPGSKCESPWREAVRPHTSTKRSAPKTLMKAPLNSSSVCWSPFTCGHAASRLPSSNPSPCRVSRPVSLLAPLLVFAVQSRCGLRVGGAKLPRPRPLPGPWMLVPPSWRQRVTRISSRGSFATSVSSSREAKCRPLGGSSSKWVARDQPPSCDESSTAVNRFASSQRIEHLRESVQLPLVPVPQRREADLQNLERGSTLPAGSRSFPSSVVSRRVPTLPPQAARPWLRAPLGGCRPTPLDDSCLDRPLARDPREKLKPNLSPTLTDGGPLQRSLQPL